MGRACGGGVYGAINAVSCLFIFLSIKNGPFKNARLRREPPGPKTVFLRDV